MATEQTHASAKITARPVAVHEIELLAAMARELFGGRALEHGALAAEIRRVSALYNAGGAPAPGDTAAIVARLRFFLPRDLPKLHAPLAELERVHAFPRRDVLRVLDLGAGLGTSTLALARFAAESGVAQRLEVDAVDRDRGALDVAAHLCARSEALGGVPVAFHPRVLDLERGSTTSLGGPYDLVLLGLFLAELAPEEGEAGERTVDRHVGRLRSLLPLLAADAALVILEPALRRTSRILHRVRDALVHAGSAPYVFAPCVRVADCPMLARERDWCHEAVPLALPPALAALARSADLRERDLSYSYLTLHMKARSLREIGAAPLLRVVGGPLRSKGKRELFVCGDVPAARLRRLDRDSTPDNHVFESLARGDVVEITSADEVSETLWGVGEATTLRVVR